MNVEIIGFLLRYFAAVQRHFSWPFAAMEGFFWLAVLVVAACVIAIPQKVLAPLRERFDSIARFDRTPLWIGIAAVAIRVALLPWIPLPDASVHDEFSYLLGAKTLAAFSVTNPMHPLAPFFESFHINVWPSYQSMYLPGQAAFMAVGVLLFNNAWWGIALAVGLMCGTITWMLRAFVPARWALLGGIFCILRYAVFSYWINGYWGGAVAALGGALLLGAWPRLRRTRQAKYGVYFSLGLVLLAFTRPFEGAMFALPIGVACLVWLIRGIIRRENMKFAAAGASVLIVSAAFLLYYNARGTGNPLVMPYSANQRLYHVTGPFVWQRTLQVPNYNHDLMRRHYILWEVPIHRALADPAGRIDVLSERLTTYYLGYFWPMALLVPAGLWFALRRRRTRFAALSFITICVAILCEAWTGMPHYMAPALGSTLIIAITGLRVLRTMHFGRIFYGRALALAAISVMAAWLIALGADAISDPYQIASVAEIRQEWEQKRANAQLAHAPGLHLVIVHDRANANIHSDWIHNEPNIDGSKVVWARDMGPYMDRYLLAYFGNRQVWYIDNDDGIRALRPYTMRDMPDCVARGLLASNCMTPVPATHAQ
jgi:hypothetical protein